jgi:hypothetical protein
MFSLHPNLSVLADSEQKRGNETALPADVFTTLREIERRALGLEPAVGSAENVAHEFGLLLDQTIAALVSLDGEGEGEAAASIDALLQAELQASDTEASSAPRLSDLCFPAVFELRRVRIELTGARNDDDRIAASERARRKLRRAIGFVLAAAANGRSAPPSARDWRKANHLAEVGSALAVRRLYADFRRALRRPDVETPEAVLRALRYAAGALATLVASTEYDAVRASDRALLRHLRERILAWGKREQSLEVGLHLLDDLWTSADLLRDINRRQELRAHDRALIEELLAEPPPHEAAWFERLVALVGLDDGLDALLGRARASEPLAPLVPSVLARLRSLA